MTKNEATLKLAEMVMGWTARSGKDTDECIPDPPVVVLDEVGGIPEWNPWTDPRQAAELAEAWCNLEGTNRSYKHEFTPYLTMFPGLAGPHEAEMKSANDTVGRICAATLAEALTGAVCKAEKLKVEEE